MDEVTLQADTREAAGTRRARRLRRTGHVPAVVYGKNLEPLTVTVSSRDLYGVLHTEAGLNALINLEVGDDKVLTVAREIQRHPVRGDITHLDFIEVSLTEAIQADVSIEFVGIPVGVREEGGIVETIETTVSIRALPTEIPASIELDIETLNIGDTLKLGDLPTIEGVEYVDDEDRAIVSILAPRKIEEELPAELEEGLELAEGEEAPAAEGEGADEAAEGAE